MRWLEIEIWPPFILHGIPFFILVTVDYPRFSVHVTALPGW
jgi:hypothetical protein